MRELTVGIVTWGALAFGGVYPWAYWPLIGASAAVSVLALVRHRVRQRIPAGIAAGLFVLAAAVSVQLVPLPLETLARISPATTDVLARYDLRYAAAAAGMTSDVAQALPPHPLSIDPKRTVTGLLLMAGFGLLLIGLVGVLDESLTVTLVRSVMVVGAIMTLVALVQKAGDGTKIYGFWSPQSVARPFGPFVNPNHYAGWMLMAVPLVFGYFLGQLQAAVAKHHDSWRARAAWFSTPAANGLIMTGFALSLMALSVVFSLSRSGIASLAIGFGLLGAFALHRIESGSWRRIIAVYLAVVAIGCVGWVGTERLAGRFDELQQSGIGGRGAVWADTVRVVRAFPVAGTGLNTFGVAMLLFQHDRTEHFEEAHSDYLQLAAEGGWLLTMAACPLLIAIMRDLRRRFREQGDTVMTFWIRAGAATGLVAIAVQEIAEFSLQMPGNAALCCVLVAIAVHRSDVAPLELTHGSRRHRADVS